MSSADLIRFWPTDRDVAACIKADAEAAHGAVLLAVHQPMKFERRVIGGSGGDPCNEHELLRAFLAENLSDGRVIVPIVGQSGIGKSHVIRWLDAQLRRRPGHGRRVIIRIPKGMSLKGVLGLLLKDLPEAIYDDFREGLQKAQEELDPDEAAGLLCEMLAYTVSEMGQEAQRRLREAPGDVSAKERAALCRADALPSLLRNQLLRDQHFVRTRSGGPGVVRRLVEQLTETRDATEVDDRQHSFGVEDLDFDGVDRDDLGSIEAAALGRIDRPERRQIATRILNEALDAAKNRLLRLDPTVSDLFDAIRAQLLAEGRELVLLVEDFAVLSGLQKQLLQVIIKEAYRDGRQVLCTMRTALAYTTGYMDTATVLTRANTEYHITDSPGTEDEIHDRISALVAAYLNAARLGPERVDLAYRRGAIDDRSISSWIPTFEIRLEDEARLTLEAFGKVGDYFLFPFNQDAIRQFSREGCIQGTRLIYNPRFVIQNVINKVLLHRESFTTGTFPPQSLGSQSAFVSPAVTSEIRRRVPPSLYERYIKFVAYWGGRPDDSRQLGALEPRLFRAVGLEPLLSADPTPVAQKREPTTPRIQEPTAESRHPTEVKWNGILDRWRAKTVIAQQDANELRKWLREALEDSIEWDWDLFRPRKGDDIGDAAPNVVFIPYAAGHQGLTADTAMAAVCREADVEDPETSARVHAALMAVVRVQGVHRGWDYDGADLDLPPYAALVERMLDQARGYIKERYFRARWNPLPAFVEGLLIGARALGIDAATKDRDPGALVGALFAGVEAAPSIASDGDDTGWAAYTDALRRCRNAEPGDARDQQSWRRHLLALVGARQGQADLVHAVDVYQLKPAIEDVLKSWDFKQAPPSQAGTADYVAFRALYADLKKGAASVERARDRLAQWRDDTRAWLGEDSDKTAVVRAVRDTLEAARVAGLTAGQSFRETLQLLEQFDAAKVMTTLAEADRLTATAGRGTTLAVLGRSPDAVVRLCDQLRSALDQLLDHIDAELAREHNQYGDDPLTEAVSSLDAELGNTCQALAQLGEL